MENKKVLIITYYWPPSGGSGVQRWLKFVKYLTRMGWEPYVFTPENPSFTIKDGSLEREVPSSVEVIKLPIWEPYHLFFKIRLLGGAKFVNQSDFITTGKKSLFQKISSWIRGNFFIPDARVYWVKPSVTFLTDFIRASHIHKIITTGPPHSIHLIGLKLKKRLPEIQWIADFRDPWSEWDLLDTLSLTAWARARHQKLERSVLTFADKVITIAPYHVKRLESLGGRKVELITNGFDEEDFGEIVHTKNDKFAIRHIGIVDELRDPRPIMEIIKNLCEESPELADAIRIEFIGNVNSAFKTYVSSNELLLRLTSFVGQVPHDKLIKIYDRTDLQLLILAHTSIAPGNLPGKLFEYLASGNPILAIGPVDGDAAKVLEETKSGLIHERSDAAGIKSSILLFYHEWKSGDAHSSGNVREYSRERLAKKLVTILES